MYRTLTLVIITAHIGTYVYVESLIMHFNNETSFYVGYNFKIYNIIIYLIAYFYGFNFCCYRSVI